MAPKRVRSSGGASSSQNPTVSPQERRENRRRLFETRPANPGRPVDLSFLDHLGTNEAFSAINWQPFLNFQGNFPFSAMVEFYAGYDFDVSTQRVSLHIFDHSFNWSLQEFSVVLGLTHSDRNVFSNNTSFSSLLTQVEESRETILQTVLAPAFRNDFPSSLTDQHLPENLRFWNKIILFNVLGRAGNFDRLNALQCYILFCLRRGIHINATYIVAHRMVISETGNQSLPFGYLIKNLFTRLQIPITGMVLPPQIPLDELTVTRMGGPAGPVQRRHQQPDPAPEEVGPYAIPAGAITNRQMYSMMTDFRRGYDTDQRVLHDRLTDIEAEVWTLTNQMDQFAFEDSD